LIVDRAYKTKIVEHEGTYFIDQTGDTRLRALLALATHAPTLPRYGYDSGADQYYDSGADQYYAISRLQGPGWYFASILPGGAIRTEAFKAAQWVLWTGFASLALVLGVLAMLLERQIAAPLRQLLLAVRQMGERRVLAPLDTARRDEIGQLAVAFAATARSVTEEIRRRDWDLQQESSGRIQIYKALQASETRYRAVAEQTGHIVYDHDLVSGRIDWAGPIPQITGYSIKEFARVDIRGWAECIHPDDRAKALQTLERVQIELGKYQTEYRFRRADGRYVYIEDEGILLTDLKDRSQHILGTMKDISERKHAEQALREAKEEADKANRAKSQFLADISHELRTPLNAILGYAQILLRDAALPGKARNGVTIIQQSGDHLLGLINDILDLAKIESDKLEIDVQPFDLRHFLQGIAGAFAVRAKQKNLDFHMNADPQLPVQVQGDERKLRQILFNLIGNAIKFTDTGEVVFAIDRDEEQIRFAVTDTGCGIRTGEMGQLFQPFQRVGDRNRAIEGAGLGLVISRRLVELLGGALHVESVFSQGSRFWFALSLPAADAPERAPAVPAVPAIGYRGPRRRILIADDKRENRAVLVDMLAPLGFRIAEAGNGQEALDVAARFQPDAVLMDMRMPVLDGLEATRRAGGHPPAAPVRGVARRDRDRRIRQRLRPSPRAVLGCRCRRFSIQAVPVGEIARVAVHSIGPATGLRQRCRSARIRQRARWGNHRSARRRTGDLAGFGPARRSPQFIGAGRAAGARRRALCAFRGPVARSGRALPAARSGRALPAQENQRAAGRCESAVMSESTARRGRGITTG